MEVMEQHKNKLNNSEKEPNGLKKKIKKLGKKLMRRNKKVMRLIETLKRIREKLKTFREKFKTLREKLNRASNMTVMLIAGVISIELLYLLIQYFPKWISLTDKVQESAGYWNFLIVLISVPVALVVWHFRDENNRQQIENQRKDINLKEFQKLSEWVSGAHLPEIKTVSKTMQKSSLKDGVEVVEKTTEQSEEYSKNPDATHFDTFSKRDGAVALQISAIYNLLPFFRGDYGESFRLPAFNLLKSAWQAMQQDSLKKLDEGHLSNKEREKTSDEVKQELEIIIAMILDYRLLGDSKFNELKQKAESPMGVALTQVLLSLNRENTKLNLRDFPEMLPNICLAGMNFHLSGVSEIARDLSDLNLNGADFRGAILTATKFQNSKLNQAKLDGANLSEAKLQDADLWEAELEIAELCKAKLCNTCLSKVNLQGACLAGAELQNVNLTYANLTQTDLAQTDLQGANLSYANLQHADLRFTKMRGASFQKANLQNAKLNDANAQYANFSYADLKACDFKWKQLKDNEELLSAIITIYDFEKNIYPDWKKTNDPEWAVLTKVQQTKAMQKFCNETGMLIVDESEIQEIMSSL